MSENSFFNEQSKVKTAIVAKYFDVWSSMIIATQNRYPMELNDEQKHFRREIH